MLITFKQSRGAYQGMVSIPKPILKKWAINEKSSTDDREVIISLDGDKIIIERVKHEVTE